MRVPSCPRWTVTAVVGGAGYGLVWHYSGALPDWAIQASVIGLGYAFLWCTSGQLVDFVLDWAQGGADRRDTAGSPDGTAAPDGGQRAEAPDTSADGATAEGGTTGDPGADDEERPAGGQDPPDDGDAVTEADRDVGTIVGKAENLLLPTFILAEAYTALSVIFAAKGLVRREDIQKNTLYYLAGTMTNFTYSIVVGVVLRIALAAAGLWPLPL